MKRLLIFFLLISSSLAVSAQKGKKVAPKPKRQEKFTKVEIATPYGNMVAILYNVTPKHRDNFIKLTKEKYFDSTLFHRVIRNFMIQGGDPESKNAKPGQMLGNGGPGYTVPAEFVDTLYHRKGALAAARLGDMVNPKKESSGSQFYIVQGQKIPAEQIGQFEAMSGRRYTPEQVNTYMKVGGTPHLDGGYTVFGQVIEGLDVLDAIAAVKTQPGDRPEVDVPMKIRIIE